MKEDGRGVGSVKGLLHFATVAVVVAVLVGGLLAVLGAAQGLRAVQTITDDVQPAALTNASILQHMTDAETGIRAWAQIGDEAAREPYERAVAVLPLEQAQLRRDAAELGSPELVTAVRAQDEAIARWFDEYAIARAEGPAGPETFSEERFQRAKLLFDEVRVVHDRVSDELADLADDARADARRDLVVLLVVTGVMLAIGLGLAVWLNALTTRQIRRPLRHLASVVHRQADGDDDVRAEVFGAWEVRRAAMALNEAADANERAREVEELVREDLHDLDRAKDDFVSNVSHELRTPLTTIAGYLELVGEEFEGRMEPRHERIFRAADRNVKRLGTLIEDLLTLSRAEARATDLEHASVALLLEDVASDIRITAARRGVTVLVDAPADLAVVADRTQISRALLNLASNAVKFSAPEGVVRLGARRLGEQAEITVADDGIGIPADELDEVGSRFFRASNAVRSQISGTGLGLRIVQTIVGNHSGTVRLDSVEGEGTTVTVLLPALGAAPVADPAAD